ncbi:MAG: MOSC domain-containing protein, partial [Hydrogenophaga sp.]|nr:MOSC domain-containing protein [Hydrogenophaga sp.]
MSPTPAPQDVQATIDQLWVYPVKSCAGIALPEAELTDTGLAYDRTWMVVDSTGEFVSQRELPRMALIQPAFKMGQLVLRAPGMLALHLALDAAETPLRVRVWDDEVDAYDMGDVAAQWFSDFLGPDAPADLKRLRLARFDPAVRRLCSPQWTGGREATTQFADGF